MQTLFLQLRTDDEKAKRHILKSVGNSDRYLSVRLLDRFSKCGGTIYGIASEWTELNGVTSYDYPSHSDVFEIWNDLRTHERVVKFVLEHLKSSKDAVVLSELWGARRPYEWPFQEPNPPPVSYFGDEVYHSISNETRDEDLIEFVITPAAPWQTTVCSAFRQSQIPPILNEAFLDEIVASTRHIIVPTRSSGYLIWSPTTETS